MSRELNAVLHTRAGWLLSVGLVQKLAELRDTLQTKIHVYNEAVLSLR